MRKNINFEGNGISIDNIKENYYIMKKLKNGYDKEREMYNVFLFDGFHILKLTDFGYSDIFTSFLVDIIIDDIKCFNSIYIITFELYYIIYIYKFKENMLKL